MDKAVYTHKHDRNRLRRQEPIRLNLSSEEIIILEGLPGSFMLDIEEIYMAGIQALAEKSNKIVADAEARIWEREGKEQLTGWYAKPGDVFKDLSGPIEAQKPHRL
jgi:hypothetical protein